MSRLRLVVLCSMLLTGCSSGTTSPPQADSAPSVTTTVPNPTSAAAPTATDLQSTTTQQEPSPTSAATTTTATAAPATTEPGVVVTEAAVSAALVEYLPGGLASTNYTGTPFCGHYLHGIEQSGDKVSAYISGWCHEYYVEQGAMEMGAGSCIHARVDLKIGDNGLSAYAHEESGDGEDQPEVFPQWVFDAMRTEQKPIVPDQPLTQAAAHFGAVPERALRSGASCAAVSEGYSLYEYGVVYWLREGRPAALDADNDGRPCEDEYAPYLVEMYWNPMMMGLEPGLLCRDLNQYGVSLEAAVGYWLREGRPDRMDADGSGIPCETVYDAVEFDALFSSVVQEAPGRFCRDLVDSGHRFNDLVAYWLLEGMPDRMDADGDGVPCETLFDPMEAGIYLNTGLREVDSGLLCRNLADRGWGYSGTVRYWMLEGMPERMDADGDGIPCETVFDQFDIDKWVEFDRIWKVGR